MTTYEVSAKMYCFDLFTNYWWLYLNDQEVISFYFWSFSSNYRGQWQENMAENFSNAIVCKWSTLKCLCIWHVIIAFCVQQLALASLPGNAEAAKVYTLAKFVHKDYCQARKSSNRFKVPVGRKFYHVRVKNQQKTSWRINRSLRTNVVAKSVFVASLLSFTFCFL